MANTPKKKQSTGGEKVRIRFDAAEPATLTVDDTTIVPGEELDVHPEVARFLVEATWTNVSIVDGTILEPRWPQDDAALDALAEKLSLRWPDPAEGNTTLSVAEKQAALEEAGFTPESVLAAPADSAAPNKEGGAE